MAESNNVDVVFHHQNLGTLTIQNGIDEIAWAYGLNTAVFPTYGGEVIQILSVYIDNMTIAGTCATYAQMEQIYRYFGRYMQIATQGQTSLPNNESSATGSAYNQVPIRFIYPQRGWNFLIYPLSAPGFRMALDVVTPTWQIQAFVVDDSPDLKLIKDGIKALAHEKLSGPLAQGTNAALSDVNQGTFSISGNINAEISPRQGDLNPDTNPFQTYTPGLAAAESQISQYSTYFNNLIGAYGNGDFSALTGAVGSQPGFGHGAGNPINNNSTTTIPPKPSNSGGAKHGHG